MLSLFIGTLPTSLLIYYFSRYFQYNNPRVYSKIRVFKHIFCWKALIMITILIYLEINISFVLSMYDANFDDEVGMISNGVAYITFVCLSIALFLTFLLFLDRNNLLSIRFKNSMMAWAQEFKKTNPVYSENRIKYYLYDYGAISYR